MTALNLRIQESGNPEIWKSGIQKIQILKMKIRVAGNVGKASISRKKTAPGPIWGHFRQIFPWAGKCSKIQFFAIFLGGPTLGVKGWIKSEAVKNASMLASVRPHPLCFLFIYRALHLFGHSTKRLNSSHCPTKENSQRFVFFDI